MAETAIDVTYNWHISSVLTGSGERPGDFVHYVQRYTRPDDPRRYSGEISTRTWCNADDAQTAASAANNGRCDFGFRGTYL